MSPDDRRVAVPPGSWHHRDEVPPAGVPLIWATDGTLVWLIYNDGSPIPDTAYDVRWWTTALIPAPPGV